MLTISILLYDLRLRHSSPSRNWVTHTGKMKITEESSYFLSTRESSLSTSSTHVLFDFLRHPASSFVIWRRSGEGKITRIPRYPFQHLKDGSLLFLLRWEMDQTSDLLCYFDGLSDSQTIQWRVNNAWKNYHPETNYIYKNS